MILRPATREDSVELAKIHQAAFAGSGEDEWTSSFISGLLAQPDGFALLAEEEGFILMRAAGGEAEILTFGVVPASHRKGVGQALLAAGAAQAARLGATALFLEVDAENLPALALYGKMGFATVGRRPQYYRTGKNIAKDALVLRADLPLGDAMPARGQNGHKAW